MPQPPVTPSVGKGRMWGHGTRAWHRDRAEAPAPAPWGWLHFGGSRCPLLPGGTGDVHGRDACQAPCCPHTGVTCVCTRTRGQYEHPHSRASLHGAISPSHLSPPSSSPLIFRKSATITAVSTATSVHPPRCCAMCLIGSSRQRQADTRAPSMHGGGVTRATRHGCAGNVLHGLGARRQHARTCVQRACKDGHVQQAGHPQEAATRTRRCPKMPPPPPQGHPQNRVGAVPAPR